MPIVVFISSQSIDTASGSVLAFTKLVTDLALDLSNHSVCHDQNLLKIAKVGQRLLSLSHLNILLLNESLLLCNIFLNIFQKQIESFSLVVSNLSQLTHKCSNIFWWVYFNALLFALIK